MNEAAPLIRTLIFVLKVSEMERFPRLPLGSNFITFDLFFRTSLTGGTVAYSTLYLLSLRGGRGEEKGDNLVRRFFFKTKPIMDVKCNRR